MDWLIRYTQMDDTPILWICIAIYFILGMAVLAGFLIGVSISFMKESEVIKEKLKGF